MLDSIDYYPWLGQFEIQYTLQLLGSMNIDDLDRIRKQIHSITVEEDGFLWADKVEDKKKGPLLSVFLAKIDESLFIEMQQYLKRAKPSFKKSKIQLYEDISWIVRFKQEEHRIKLNKQGAITSIAKDLEKQFQRSAKTIRQRMQKFLSKIEPEDIRKHLRINADFTFDSKRVLIDTKYKIKQQRQADHNSQTEIQQTFQIPQNQHSFRFKHNSDVSQKIFEVKEEMTTSYRSESKHEQIYNTSKSGIMKISSRNRVISNQQNVVQKSSISSKQSDCKLADRSAYRYGSKPVKEPIYICYNLIENSFFCVSQTFLKQQTPQFFTNQRDLQTKADNCTHQRPQSQQKLKREVEVIEISEDQQYQAQGQEHNHRITNSEQIKREYQQTKKWLANMMQKLESDTWQSQNHVSTSRSLASAAIQPQIKQEVSQDMSQSIGNREIEQNPKEEEQQSQIRKYESSQIRKRERERQQQLMYQLSNKQQHLKLIQERPNLKNRYVWSKEEDKILELFSSGNPEAFRQYLTCLMRYKSLEIIKERCQFLQISINQQQQHILQQFWNKVKDRY